MRASGDESMLSVLMITGIRFCELLGHFFLSASVIPHALGLCNFSKYSTLDLVVKSVTRTICRRINLISNRAPYPK